MSKLCLNVYKYILGRIDLNFWGFGEQLNKFWGFGEHKQNTFRELIQKKLRDLGRSEHYFQGAREQEPPWGPLYYNINSVQFKVHIQD